MSSAQKLWDNWSKYDDLDKVYRQGFLKVKAFGYGNEAKRKIDKYHAESTLSHSARTAMLFSDILDLWPSYFKNVDKYAALKVALNHDIGELVVGDVCDDGRQEHKDKKIPEWNAVQEHYFQYEEDAYMAYKGIHRQFEGATTFLGQTIKMADKLDFVAKLIKLEGEGVNFKKLSYHFTENDTMLAKEISSNNFVDVCANHYRHMMAENCFDKRLVWISIQFLSCGLRSNGRAFFGWWKYNHKNPK